jgi:hypothetical protein
MGGGEDPRDGIVYIGLMSDSSADESAGIDVERAFAAEPKHPCARLLRELSRTVARDGGTSGSESTGVCRAEKMVVVGHLVIDLARNMKHGRSRLAASGLLAPRKPDQH